MAAASVPHCGLYAARRPQLPAVTSTARPDFVSLRFHIEGLGFSQKITWGEAPARAVMLDTGDGNYLEVFEREGVPAETSGEANILHFALRCDDCESATEAARAAGAKVTMEAKVPDVFTEMGLKTKISFVLGPDGEIVEFFESSDL